jgi:Flp pilus assembly protein TadD
MNDLFFWLQWKSSYRALYVALLILFLSGIAAVCISYVYGDLYTIGWNTTGEWRNITLGLEVFNVNQFDISQESTQFLLQKRYVSGGVTIHPWISYTYLACVLIAFVCFLTIISYVDLWLYLAGMTLFLFFAVGMHTELIGIFGIHSKAPTALIIILFGGLTYYFNAFGKNTNFFLRLAALTASMALIVLAIIFTSDVSAPLLYVANYSLVVPIIICIIFMFIVGYDFLQFLVMITSYGKSDFKKGNSIWNFILIGTLYLINLYLVYYQPAFIKDMGIVLLQPFAVLAISAVLGIWMFEKKESVNSMLPFNPLGAILYLTLGIITFSTISFGYATANDALITTLELSALYIQIGMGLGIFVYVLANFWTKYKNKEEVYKQFYITYQVPFFVARGMGWVIVLYFLFSTNRFVFSSSKAAYYNSIADVYLYTGQDELAVSFYKEAYTNEFQNQRSSYTLATYYEQQAEKELAFKYYENALNKNTSPFAYTALSNFYINNNQLFPAMFMIQDGLKDYPNDPHLLNNLGYIYRIFSESDSAAYFFNKAAKYTDDDIPAANLLAYFGAKGKLEECAAILNQTNTAHSPTYIANKIAITTMLGKKIEDNILSGNMLTDTLLTAEQFTALYNLAFNSLAEKDTLLDHTLSRYSTYEDNAFYASNLLYAKAIHVYYSQTSIVEAMALLKEITEKEPTPTYLITLANWQLKAGLNQEAYETYRKLITHPDQRMVAYKCLAALEAGNPSEVTETLQALSASLMPGVANMARTLRASLAKPSVSTYDTLSARQKVQALHYHALTATEAAAFKNTIKDPVQILLLELNTVEQLNARMDYIAAMSAWNTLSTPENLPAAVLAQANLQYLKILAGLKQWDALKKELTSTSLLPKNLGYIDYYTARVLQNSPDSLKALPYYKKAISLIGYDPLVQIDYADYLAATVGEIEAVEKLVEAKKVIQYSKPLSLAYINACIKLGLYKAAGDELQNIESSLTTAEITSIKNQFYSAPVNQ